MGAIDDIAAERLRQISAEGWSPDHDNKHDLGEMANAAACYAMTPHARMMNSGIRIRLWPWDSDWWKPKDRRRDLVRAGALIVAEIDRIDRLNADVLKRMRERLEMTDPPQRPSVVGSAPGSRGK